MQRAGNHLLSRAGLAANENIRIRWADARDQLQHRLHRGRFSDQGGPAFGAQQPVLRFQALAAPQRRAQLHLCAHDGHQARVVPGLLDEIARAAAHGFHSEINAAPRGHHDHRNHVVDHLDAAQQIEAFLTGGCVPGVVQVHEDHVEIARLEGGQNSGRRIRGLNFEPLAFKQQAQSLQHIRLVVGDEETPVAHAFHSTCPSKRRKTFTA